jgi:hypothetical protein
MTMMDNDLYGKSSQKGEVDKSISRIIPTFIMKNGWWIVSDDPVLVEPIFSDQAVWKL